MRPKRMMLRVVWAVLLALLGMSAPAWALFDLSADPRKGGRDIRFDVALTAQAVREEELTITAESDEAVPYRVYMTLLSPLRDEQGRTLPKESLTVFSPTNSLGDLRARLETAIALGQTDLYSSNSAGDSDRFILVFHLNAPPDLPGGVYRSSITFTMEPMTPTAGLTPQTVTLELRVESKPAFRLSIRNNKGAERLDLGLTTSSGTQAPAVLGFQIESNLGQPYRIFQEMKGPLVSDAGQAVKENAIQFSAEGASGGKMTASGNLDTAPVILYESDPSGNSAEFRVSYQLADASEVSAGRSTGTLYFRVESASPYTAGQSTQVPIDINVEPMLKMDIEIPGGFGLQFGNLKSGEEAPEKHVLLKVRSNLRKPYQVSQIVARKMSTPGGSALPDSAFLYSVQRTQTGTIEAVAFRPVPVGESPLFLSDAAGTPEIIECIYSLTIPIEARSGPYGTEIKYSITTL